MWILFWPYQKEHYFQCVEWTWHLIVIWLDQLCILVSWEMVSQLDVTMTCGLAGAARFFSFFCIIFIIIYSNPCCSDTSDWRHTLVSNTCYVWHRHNIDTHWIMLFSQSFISVNVFVSVLCSVSVSMSISILHRLESILWKHFIAYEL